MIKFLDLQKQYHGIKSEVDAAMKEVIENTAFIGGDQIKLLEKDFALFQNAVFCNGVANGTDALEIVLEAMNLPEGSEVIVPANSFISSAEAVTRVGLKVVFCDCNPDNYTICLDSLKEKITPNTSAIMAVHLYGHPADLGGLLEIAKQYDLKIVEDCAQAHGAEYKGQRIGAIGDAGTFSFYPGKNLGAYGDAGAIVTNDEALAVQCRMLANHGRIEKYNHRFEGRNSRIDNLQAAVLNVKLNYLESWTEQRIKIADYYLANLPESEALVLPKREQWARQVYHLFVVRTPFRDELKEFLKSKDIQSGIHYPIALPKLEAYHYLNQQDEDFFANNNDTKLLSLPIGEHLSLDEAEQVVQAVGEFVNIHA